MIAGKLVIFDYDGVIADSLALWKNAFAEAGTRHGIGYRLDSRTINSLEHITFGAILGQAGLENDSRSEAYVADIISLFSSGSSGVKYFDGIGSLLGKLHRAGNLVCINTANNSGIVRMRLQEEGLDCLITEIAGGDTPGSKSEKILYMMRKFSSQPQNTFMIGDSLGDITEGKKAGVKTIAAGYGWHNAGKLLSGSPDYFCADVDELEQVFLSLK